MNTMRLGKMIMILVLMTVNPLSLSEKNRATLIVCTLELLKWYKIWTASLS